VHTIAQCTGLEDTPHAMPRTDRQVYRDTLWIFPIPSLLRRKVSQVGYGRYHKFVMYVANRYVYIPSHPEPSRPIPSHPEPP
jgi:hypothetical protein